MNKFLVYLNIFLLLFTFSCKKNDNKENEFSLIDGYYINDEFDIWKISAIDNGMASLAIYKYSQVNGTLLDKDLEIAYNISKDYDKTGKIREYLNKCFRNNDVKK